MVSGFCTSFGRGFGPRLRTVAELVPPGARVADVGSGPGILPQALLRTGRCPRCIATERSATRARELEALGPIAGLEVRVGDGLDPLDARDRIQVLAMSGFGGETMARILERGAIDRLGVRRLVLQPQGGAGELRHFLRARGLVVIEERIVVERGRHYLVFAAEAWPLQASPGSPGTSAAGSMPIPRRVRSQTSSG
jgi:tRNA (adenine22-N1)-methyltransferase